jgi:hypothetical protein
MKTRFTIYDRDHDLQSSSVQDIIELGDAVEPKASDARLKALTRRRIMTRLGFIVDQMLDGSYGYDHFVVERE